MKDLSPKSLISHFFVKLCIFKRLFLYGFIERGIYTLCVLIVVSEPTVAEQNVVGPVNRRSHTSRLGLARALSRSADTQDQAKQLYQEVISMAPGVSCYPLHLDFRHFRTAFTMAIKLLLVNESTDCLGPWCLQWASSAAGAIRPSGSSGGVLQVPSEACGRAELRRCLHLRRDRPHTDEAGAVRPSTAGAQPCSIRQSHGTEWVLLILL